MPNAFESYTAARRAAERAVRDAVLRSPGSLIVDTGYDDLQVVPLVDLDSWANKSAQVPV